MRNEKPDMQEGPEAFTQFRAALKSVLSVQKSALPPKPSRTKKKAAKRKA